MLVTLCSRLYYINNLFLLDLRFPSSHLIPLVSCSAYFSRLWKKYDSSKHSAFSELHSVTTHKTKLFTLCRFYSYYCLFILIILPFASIDTGQARVHMHVRSQHYVWFCYLGLNFHVEFSFINFWLLFWYYKLRGGCLKSNPYRLFSYTVATRTELSCSFKM
jgi:hypothetical protein